jgi:hypothetical protein
MSTATEPARGFSLACPKCGSAHSIRIEAHDVYRLACAECGEELPAEDLRAMIGRWRALFDWLETAPPIATED